MAALPAATDFTAAATQGAAKTAYSNLRDFLAGLFGTDGAQINAPVGAVGAPGIAFAGDLDSGLYRIGANNIGVAAGGIKILDIATTGLGVTGTLGVSGVATFSNRVLTGADLTSGWTHQFQTASGAALAAVNATATSGTMVVQNTATAGDNIFATFGTEGVFTNRGTISYNRGGGLTAYNTTSDYRAKDILGPVDAVSILTALNPIMGQMKGATIPRPMLVAHEAQAVAPWAVTGAKDAVDEEGNPIYQQLSEGALTPLLVAGWQNHHAEIAAIKTHIGL